MNIRKTAIRMAVEDCARIFHNSRIFSSYRGVIQQFFLEYWKRFRHTPPELFGSNLITCDIVLYLVYNLRPKKMFAPGMFTWTRISATYEAGSRSPCKDRDCATGAYLPGNSHQLSDIGVLLHYSYEL